MRVAVQSSIARTAYRKPAIALWFSLTGTTTQDWLRRERTVSPLSNLIQSLREAQSILKLPNNWDDAGSPAISRETFRRAAWMLLLHAIRIWFQYATSIPVPRILAGPDGSIDLHWKTRRRELLISIPSDPNEPAPYYGDNFASDKRKGEIPLDALDLELFVWLTTSS